MENLGTFDPFSINVFNIASDIVWPDGTTNIPTDNRKQSFDCPFNENDLEPSDTGRITMYTICFGLLMIMAFVSGIIWFKYWKLGIVALTERAMYSTGDILLAVTILLEFFMYNAMGPDTAILSELFADIGEAVSVNLEFVDLKDGVFWRVVYGMYGAVFLWVVCLLLGFFTNAR